MIVYNSPEHSCRVLSLKVVFLNQRRAVPVDIGNNGQRLKLQSRFLMGELSLGGTQINRRSRTL